MLTYPELQQIYQSIFNHGVISVFVNIAKALSAVFVLIQLVRRYMKGASNPEEKMKPNDFIRPLVIVALIISYSYIMQGLDLVSTAVDTEMNTYFSDDKTISQKKELSKLKEDLQNKKAKEADNSFTGIIVKAYEVWDQILDYPYLFIFKIVEALGDMFDSLVYTVALVVRFGMLFLLRVLGPLALVASIIGKYENAFWHWLSTYVIYYLWLYAFFIINLFFNLLYKYSYAAFQASSDDRVEYAVGCVILAGAIAKYILYKKSKAMLSEVLQLSPHKD